MLPTAAARVLAGGLLVGTAHLAQVATPARAELWPHGQVRLSPSVRCSPGYRVVELYVKVSQPGGSAAQAYRVPDVSCDGAWHRVPVRLPTVTRTPLRPGPATVGAIIYVQARNGPPTAARGSGPATLTMHAG